MVEHPLGKGEVVGSIPTRSTTALILMHKISACECALPRSSPNHQFNRLGRRGACTCFSGVRERSFGRMTRFDIDEIISIRDLEAPP